MSNFDYKFDPRLRVIVAFHQHLAGRRSTASHCKNCRSIFSTEEAEKEEKVAVGWFD